MRYIRYIFYLIGATLITAPPRGEWSSVWYLSVSVITIHLILRAVYFGKSASTGTA